jgi:hypothetical protein
MELENMTNETLHKKIDSMDLPQLNELLEHAKCKQTRLVTDMMKKSMKEEMIKKYHKHSRLMDIASSFDIKSFSKKKSNCFGFDSAKFAISMCSLGSKCDGKTCCHVIISGDISHNHHDKIANNYVPHYNRVEYSSIVRGKTEDKMLLSKTTPKYLCFYNNEVKASFDPQEIDKIMKILKINKNDVVVDEKIFFGLLSSPKNILENFIIDIISYLLCGNLRDDM